MCRSTSSCEDHRGIADAETELAEIHSDAPKSERCIIAPEDFRGTAAEFRKETIGSEQILQFKIAESTEARIQLRGLVTQQSADAFPEGRTEGTLSCVRLAERPE